MPKVFISHSWKDDGIAKRLAEQLKRDGAEIWIDYARILGGDSLPDRIGKALEWCDTLLLVWSSDALKSYYVTLEWETALDMQKRIIPCMLDNTPKPTMLRSKLYIPLQTFDEGYNQLAHSFGLQVHQDPPPSTYMPAAADSLAEEPTENKHVWKTKETPPPAGRKVNRWKTLPLRKILISAVVIAGLGCAYWIGDRYFIYPDNEQAVPAEDEKANPPNVTPMKPMFRSSPLTLSIADVKALMVDHDFYCKTYDWSKVYSHPEGKGFSNDYNRLTINGDQVVVDRASSLMWQQGGSAEDMTKAKADEWIKSLNNKGYASYKDWHLPTLEEGMSLMEREKKNGDLYIDPLFDQTQRWIWTGDKVGAVTGALVVSYYGGNCNSVTLGTNVSVRAVRSVQSSAEYFAPLSPANQETKLIKPAFRSVPMELSPDDMKAMLKSLNLFDSSDNKTSKGFANDYELQTIKGDDVVVDRASGLIWQQGGSKDFMTKEKAAKWIKSLNAKGFAGHKDWRLPTLEEAMSLMEPKQSGDLYIDPLFDKTQRWIWTSDKVEGGPWAWVVTFGDGYCDDVFNLNSYYYYVRAVRLRQPSAE